VPESRLQRGETALVAAASKGRLAIMEYLVAQGADVNIAKTVPRLCGRLLAVCCSGLNAHPLLHRICQSGITALMRAAMGGYFEAVEYLVEAGADIHAVSHVRDP
jgi:ankyrin repeat protein